MGFTNAVNVELELGVGRGVDDGGGIGPLGCGQD